MPRKITTPLDPLETPYLTTPDAYLLAERLEDEKLLDADYFVQLLPVSLPEFGTLNYVLRFFAAQDDELPVTQLTFLEGARRRQNTSIIYQLQDALGGWGFGEYKANFLLTRKLPTTANTRRFRLRLLVDQAA